MFVRIIEKMSKDRQDRRIVSKFVNFVGCFSQPVNVLANGLWLLEPLLKKKRIVRIHY